MNARRAGWFLVARVGATLAAGVLIGLLLGRVWAGIALALAGMLGWQLLNLYWLDDWLRDRSRRDPPDSSGVWGDVVARVVRLHRRKRFHKQRLLDAFRELRHSTAAMPDGVLILNAQWEILWFNRMAGQLLDLRRKADIGIRIVNLIRDPALARYLAREQFDEPLVVARNTGPQVHLSFQVVPYSGTQRLMLVRDVSHMVALESMRKDFVANASHELRSPLTVMTGYLETLLQDDALDPALRGPLAEMQRQTQRMNGIVNDLLDLSRLDALASEAPGNRVDVAALAAMLRKDVLARPVKLQVSVDLQTTAQLAGDEAELMSAFSNLVDNAVKYTPPGGRVAVEAGEEGGVTRITVRDTGAGIAADELPRIWDRLYRSDRTRHERGLGLGLSFVRAIVEAHGGRVEVESRPESGSTFTVILPGAPR